MRTPKNQFFAEEIVAFYKRFAPSRTETYAHFKAQLIPSSTICNCIDRFVKTSSAQYSTKRGFKPSATAKSMIKRVRQQIINDPNTSLRTISARMNISPSSVFNCKRKAGIITRVCPKAPVYTDDHTARCIDGCQLLVARLADADTIVIMDDESYCLKDPSELPGRKFVHIVPGVKTPPKALVHGKTKFAKKYGVWQAIASNGLKSPPVFIQGTMNAYRYLEECIKPVLLPWIVQNFDINKCLFWPDLAQYHYTKNVRTTLADIGLDMVTREENTPNLPQCRPIERYWALVKRKLKKFQTPAETVEDFADRWQECASEVERVGREFIHQFHR